MLLFSKNKKRKGKVIIFAARMLFTRRLLLSISTALLLWAAWPAGGFAPLLFIALVPLLILEDRLLRHEKAKKATFFYFSWICMLLFNLLTTWWIWFASPGGMVLAVIFNSLFMALVLQLFHITKRKLGYGIGYVSLIVYWTSFEFIHHFWELSWPWLSLGNGLAAFPSLIQWYEYTGILGGTVWILALNCLLAYYLNGYLFSPRNLYIWRSIVFYIPLLLIPMVISGIIKGLHVEKRNPVIVTVVQPNIDPYNEKFSGNSDEQLAKMLSLAAEKIDINTDYVVFPETALPDGLWEEDLESSDHLIALKKFKETYPRLNIVIGMVSNRYYAGNSAPTPTARAFSDGNGFYDSYNTGMQLGIDSTIQLHHKSKLVIGVEKIPFSGLFGIFEKFAINLGGASGSLGTQDIPTVFRSASGNVAPVICYESVYGEYVGEYINQGAEAIFIMTNDGWWRDTPGYRQHNQYARLRAIESRRPVARSANTGISCFIDQFGNMYQETKWWVPAVISQKMQFNDELTFYTKYGDYTGRIAVIGSAFMLLLLLLSNKKRTVLN